MELVEIRAYQYCFIAAIMLSWKQIRCFGRYVLMRSTKYMYRKELREDGTMFIEDMMKKYLPNSKIEYIV